MADILIAGIAVVDAIARPVDAFPAPGGLRFFDHLTFTTGGCAVNAALALAKLSVASDLVAAVGNDPMGDFVIAELARHGVSSSNVIRDPARSTSFSFVAVPSGGERSFLHTRGANAGLAPRHVTPALLHDKRLVFVTGVMLMDSFDGPPAADLLAHARAAGATTVLDTVFVEGVGPARWQECVLPSLPHLDYFIPSEPEALAISQASDARSAAGFFHAKGARNVCIKLGSRGVLCSTGAGTFAIIPPCPVARVVDATGAGDCWAAGFIAGLAENRSFHDSARLGNAVAALSIQSPGATTGITSRAQALTLLQAS